jgi:hypothetical protein
MGCRSMRMQMQAGTCAWRGTTRIAGGDFRASCGAAIELPMYQQGGYPQPGGFGPPGGFGGQPSVPFGGHAPAPYHGGQAQDRGDDRLGKSKGAKDPVLALSR